MALTLPLDEVRRLAQEIGLREVEYNDTSRAIVFLSDDGTRFNGYYTTGTVGTYLFHPRQGKTQLFLFRRHVSVELLKDIFNGTMSGEWSAAANVGGDLADGEGSAARKAVRQVIR